MNHTVDFWADRIAALIKLAEHYGMTVQIAGGELVVSRRVSDVFIAQTEVRWRAAPSADDPAASAVVSPPTDRADLRDRIAEALEREDAHNAGYDHGFCSQYGVDSETDGFVDAVLAVLPEPVDRAAVRAETLREAADVLGRMDYDTDSQDYGYDTYRDAWNGGVMDGADKLRRLAAEAHDTGTQQPAPTSRLSGQHADALWDAIAPPGPDRPSYPVQHERVCRVVADIVDDVTAGGGAQQPDTEAPTADRPAVLREIATTLDQLAETDVIRKRRSLATARRLLAVELRRMADDAPAPVAEQPAAEARTTWTPGPVAVAQAGEAARTTAAAYLAAPCDACEHTLNWHRNDVGCTVPDCVCGRFREPERP